MKAEQQEARGRALRAFAAPTCGIIAPMAQVSGEGELGPDIPGGPWVGMFWGDMFGE